MAIGIVTKKRAPLYCSFCGKEQGDVGYLVAGPTVFICNECVELCREIGHEMLTHSGKALPPGEKPRRCDTNIVDLNGDCIACAAANGEVCRQPTPPRP